MWGKNGRSTKDVTEYPKKTRSAKLTLSIYLQVSFVRE